MDVWDLQLSHGPVVASFGIERGFSDPLTLRRLDLPAAPKARSATCDEVWRAWRRHTGRVPSAAAAESPGSSDWAEVTAWLSTASPDEVLAIG
jgi:hypothetical protein